MNGKTAKLLRKAAEKIPTKKSTKNLYRNMKRNWNTLSVEGRTHARKAFENFIDEAK